MSAAVCSTVALNAPVLTEAIASGLAVEGHDDDGVQAGALNAAAASSAMVSFPASR